MKQEKKTDDTTPTYQLVETISSKKRAFDNRRNSDNKFKRIAQSKLCIHITNNG
jgi:hypothetical protein